MKKKPVKIPMIKCVIGSRPIFSFIGENETLRKHSMWLSWLSKEKKQRKVKSS